MRAVSQRVVQSVSALLITVVCLSSAAAFSTGKEAADKTLSPYFFVEDGDGSVDRLPLEKTAVHVAISGVIAEVTVDQTYKNEGKRPINARYVFPASTRAAVHGLKMTVGDRIVEAKIEPRGRARQEFEKAKQEGKSASLLEQDRPNVFSMNVANIMPGERITVQLRYSELIVPTNAVYEFVYPTVVGPRYANQASTAQSEQWIAGPYLHEGTAPTATFELNARLAAGIPIQALSCPSHQISPRWAADRSRVDVAVSPSPSDGNRDFILHYRLAGEAISTGLLLYKGERENFFLLMAQPPARVKPEDIPPREYVFILDVSGSMFGFPLDTAKHLLKDLVEHLRPTDRFNLILFSGASRLLSPRSLAANADNVAAAVQLIEQQRGGGGTELLPAIEQAFSLPHDSEHARTFVVITDGYIQAEKEVFRHIHDNLGTANVFAFGIGSAVNRYLIEGLAKAGMGEPFIVTDAGHAAVAAAQFRRYIEAPVLTRVKLESKGFAIYDMEPAAIPDLLAERPLIVHGKWRGSPGGSLQLSGRSGAGPYTRSIPVSSVAPDPANQVLAQLWARSRIANLSDFNFGNDSDEAKEQITALGMSYNLLTRYTSFIAVHRQVRNPSLTAVNVAQPLPMPEGVSDAAIGVTEGAEPDAVWLAAALAVMAMAIAFRQKRRAWEQHS